MYKPTSKTFVFFPVEVGLAHIARSLVVAEELHSRGNKVYFAISERKIDLFKKTPVTLIPIKKHLDKDSLMVVEKLVDINYLKPFVDEYYRLLEEIKPHVVVVDFNLSAAVAAQAHKLPVVIITGSGGLPYDTYLPNPNLNRFLYSLLIPGIRIAFRTAKKQIAKTLVSLFDDYQMKKSPDQFFDDMHYIIPEDKNYLPLMGKRGNISYVGGLSWKGFGHNVAIPPKKKKIKTIYLSFGGTGFDPKKLLELTNELLAKGYYVIVSGSTIAETHLFPKHANVYVNKFIDGKKASMVADLVVCHGGYGTMCDAIEAGRPIVSIPFNPDQILHSFRFQELGLCKTTVDFSSSFIKDAISLKWDRFQQLGSDVPTNTVMNAITEVFTNYDKYLMDIKKYGYLCTEKRSEQKAADILEKILLRTGRNN